jgi:lactoylglutathione lyase
MEGTGDLRQAVPFFKVADVERSLDFYRDGLGFQTRHKWEVDGRLRWCWLQRGGVALMLQQFPTEGQNAWCPEGKVGEGVSICVMCDDALALYREFRSRGLDASRPFVGNGLWVTSVSDPDGFRLEFESPADAPEETEYAEA